MAQDIKYSSPETRKAMIGYATENLVNTFGELPGGNMLSEKQYERMKEQCRDTLEAAKTFEEMQQLINGMIQKIEVLVENADVRMAHWQESEQKIEELRHEFEERFSVINELEEQRDSNIRNIVQDFKDRLNGKEEEINPFEDNDISEFEAPGEEKEVAFEVESISTEDAFENPFEDEKNEEQDSRIIERDGQKYIVTKDAVYDEQNQLVEPGELRTIGASEKENIEQGHVVINKGTYNMVLTLDEYAEFLKSKDKERITNHEKESELNI